MTSTVPAVSPLLLELQRVHEMLRSDLAECRALANEAAAGAPAGRLRAGVAQLASNGPLFRLKVTCISYCQLVHRHHGGEDELLFPAVRRLAPELSAVIDRLEADHRLVAVLLDRLEAAAGELGPGADPSVGAAARSAVIEVLTELSAHLLAHLDAEEDALAPVLASWAGWPPAGTG